MIGPPGVGKSEFTIWLAGQMKLPVYRLCLSNPRLTDDRLAQLLSQSAITYNSVLIQVDEFQQMVTRWVRSASSEANNFETSGVTAGGLLRMLTRFDGNGTWDSRLDRNNGDCNTGSVEFSSCCVPTSGL